MVTLHNESKVTMSLFCILNWLPLDYKTFGVNLTETNICKGRKYNDRNKPILFCYLCNSLRVCFPAKELLTLSISFVF